MDGKEPNPDANENVVENVPKVVQIREPKEIDTFRLCFAFKEQIGKSNVKIDKPLTVKATVTPKFYINDPLKGSDLAEHLQRLIVKGPREKYKYALTENQRYGWYQDQLIDSDKEDRRLNFAKNTNHLIVEYLRTREKIRP